MRFILKGATIKSPYRKLKVTNKGGVNKQYSLRKGIIMKMFNRFLVLAIILLFAGCITVGAGSGSSTGSAGSGKGLTKEQLKRMGVSETKS